MRSRTIKEVHDAQNYCLHGVDLVGGKTSNKNENEVYYCQLHRQILMLESTPELSESALSVGLAERSSTESL